MSKDIDYGSILESLNGKIDLDMNNTGSSGKSTAVGWGIPMYSTAVSKSCNTEYISDLNGYACCYTNYSSASHNQSLYIGGVLIQHIGTDIVYGATSVFAPVKIGQTYKIETSGNKVFTMLFIPCSDS